MAEIAWLAPSSAMPPLHLFPRHVNHGSRVPYVSRRKYHGRPPLSWRSWLSYLTQTRTSRATAQRSWNEENLPYPFLVNSSNSLLESVSFASHCPPGIYPRFFVSIDENHRNYVPPPSAAADSEEPREPFINLSKMRMIYKLIAEIRTFQVLFALPW
jgi:hypothetical protein